jgi:rhodanese-related sulfurtransferase
MKLGKLTILLAATLLAGPALGNDTGPVPAPQAAPPASATQPGVPLVSQDALLARQAKHDPALLLLDVRTPEEFAAGHVPGAVNIPHDQVSARLGEVPKDKDVVLYCRSGHRASLAATVLAKAGYTHLSHLDGDMNGWVEKGRPVEGAAPPAAPRP